MKYGAGRLRRRVTIEQVTETRNSYGDPVPSWATFATVYAERITMSGGETYEANQRTSRNREVYRTRRYSGIVPKMRIVDGTRTFDIAAVREDQWGRWMFLDCVERNL